jgi:hypothetical protein
MEGAGMAGRMIALLAVAVTDGVIGGTTLVRKVGALDCFFRRLSKLIVVKLSSLLSLINCFLEMFAVFTKEGAFVDFDEVGVVLVPKRSITKRSSMLSFTVASKFQCRRSSVSAELSLFDGVVENVVDDGAVLVERAEFDVPLNAAKNCSGLSSKSRCSLLFNFDRGRTRRVSIGDGCNDED